MGTFVLTRSRELGEMNMVIDLFTSLENNVFRMQMVTQVQGRTTKLRGLDEHVI